MNGFLLIDKPAGFTSNDVLNILKRRLKVRKMGHTGTLDPFATGLLVVGLGSALKKISQLNDEPKIYTATLKLGEKTDTMDLTGRVIGTAPVPLLSPQNDNSPQPPLNPSTPSARLRTGLRGGRGSYSMNQKQIDFLVRSLIGHQEQIPPMYSAKKIGGKKLYELARKGVVVERKAVPITIYNLEVFPDRVSEGFLSFRVSCSRGTYVRVLGETIAERLGTMGHLTALRRLAAGPFSVQDAVNPLGEWKVEEKLLPL